jgi:DNA replicative helicase MCM subunit Mcm2 (Cdc46/Mcm family)
MFNAFMCREALSVKQCVHVRITGLPWASDSVGRQAAPDLGSIRSAHVGRLLCMRATVLRATAVQMLERQRTYACKKCKHRCASAVLQ